MRTSSSTVQRADGPAVALLLAAAPIAALIATLIAACSSSDPLTSAPPQTNYCTHYEAAQLDSAGGLLSGTLRADLQGDQRLLITRSPAGVLSSFDSQTGEFSYQPPASRLPDLLEYQQQDSSGRNIALYRHYWVPAPLRIMPLGDSITSGVEYFDGQDHPAPPQRTGYRLALYQRLSASNVGFDFIGQGGQRAGEQAGLADPDNNGYPGVDIAFIDSKLFDILDEGHSDIVLLHIGTNNTPPDAADLVALLERFEHWAALNHPLRILVSTLVPKRDTDKQAVVDQFNADLRARLRSANMDSVILVEQALALQLDDISSEAVGVHPNAGGYLKMADVWYDALEASQLIPDCAD